jgi:Domain of unknown function (DUF5666)
MRGWLTFVAVIVLTAGPMAPGLGAPPSPPPTSMTGTIASVGSDSVVVTTAARRERVRMTATTRVEDWVPAQLADIKTGDMVGVTSRKEMNGSLTAVEIHIFPAGRQTRGRQFPMANDTMMTNAPVTSVVSAVSGRSLTLSYGGKPVKINVLASTDIRRITAGTRGELRAGRRITAFGTANDDGSLAARTVIVYQGR